jgi:hypothetical protein
MSKTKFNKNKDEQRAITSKLGKAYFFYDSFVLLFYPPKEVLVNIPCGFRGICQTKFKCKNEQEQ